MMDFEGRSMKAQMRNVNRLGSRFCLIMGEDEIQKGSIKVKDMRSQGVQDEVEISQLVEYLKEREELKC